LLIHFHLYLVLFCTQTILHENIIRHAANIVPLLEVSDMLMMGNRPDDRCIFTYVSTIYTRFREIARIREAQIAKIGTTLVPNSQSAVY
jgi:hypothetical protein